MVVSDIGDWILKNLRSKLCPEPLLNPQAIEFASPTDENSDYTLGIFFYDLRENLDHVNTKLTPTEDRKLRFPPHNLVIYYMLYINAAAQIGVKSLDAQKIITRTAQVLFDLPTVDTGSFRGTTGQFNEIAKITESRLTFDEKTKIWSTLNKPLQPALYFEASPVFIASEKIIGEPKVMKGTYNLSETR
jgi:hypothetical protein